MDEWHGENIFFYAVVELIYAVSYINQQNWHNATFPFKGSWGNKQGDNSEQIPFLPSLVSGTDAFCPVSSTIWIMVFRSLKDQSSCGQEQ